MVVCGGNTIGVLDFSPTFIIKPYHQKGGTEVPPYDNRQIAICGAINQKIGGRGQVFLLGLLLAGLSQCVDVGLAGVKLLSKSFIINFILHLFSFVNQLCGLV